MKKQYKSSMTKNHKINQNIFFFFSFFDGVPLSLLSCFIDFVPEIKKEKALCENRVTNDV